VHALQPAEDGLEAGDLAEGEERREREERGRDQEDEGFSPRPVNVVVRLDVQITQGRILR